MDIVIQYIHVQINNCKFYLIFKYVKNPVFLFFFFFLQKILDEFSTCQLKKQETNALDESFASGNC